MGSEKSYASDWNNILSQCDDMLTILQATDNAGADFTLDNPNSGSDEGSFTFESDAQAFEAGADNMDEFGAWGKNGFANSFTNFIPSWQEVRIFKL